MEHRSWVWRKRPLEKTIVGNFDDASPVAKSVPSENEELVISLEMLKEKLASVVDECSDKEELVRNYKQKADNAMAEKQKGEEQIYLLRRELQEITQKKAAGDERLAELNSALKSCMEQLSLVRAEQERRIHEVARKMEERLADASKKLASSTAENEYLSKALLVKETLMEDLEKIKARKEGECGSLMRRLDLVEKENAFLIYEFRALQKELGLKNEEMEYWRRLDVENGKKIKKLEGECRGLRSLARKCGIEVSRRRCTNGGGSFNRESNLALLMDLLHDLENENKILRGCLCKRDDEISLFQQISADSNLNSSSSSQENAECKMMEASEMSLMADFAEMEKLAIVAVETPSDASNFGQGSRKGSMGRELVSMEDEARTKESSCNKTYEWLQDVRNLILEEHRLSEKSIHELLGEITTDLRSTIRPQDSKLLPVSGYITWKSSPSSPHSNLVQEMSHQYHSTVRDKFEKYLGGNRPGTAMELESVQTVMLEMEELHSVSQVEIKALRKVLDLIKDKDLAASLCNELEILKELKRKDEDQIANLKLINEDLHTQLAASKAKENEVLQKLSSVQAELDNKCHCCEEQEAMCLELQLQLERITSNHNSVENKGEQELLQTGVEITKASAKLAECEESIVKLVKKLKALGSAKELAVVERFLSITDTNIKDLNQRSSLRDQMISEDNMEMEDPQSLKREEIISSYGKTTNPRANLGINAKAGALIILPSKNKGEGTGFLRKLLLRRKKSKRKST